MSLPPLYALRAFDAAARLGSFSQAAQLLHLTPGAISRHVRTLEEWFNCTLFHRHGPRVVLSDAGRALAAELAAGFEQLERACAHFRQQNGELRLKAPSTLTMRWLLPALQSFNEFESSFRVQLTSVWMDKDSIDFHREPFDCAILLGDGQFGAETHAQRLFDEWLIPLCAPDFPLTGQNYDVIHPSPDRRDWRRWLQRSGMTGSQRLNQGKVFDTLEQGNMAAISGHGITVGDLLLSQSALESGQLVTPWPQAVATGDSYYLVWSQRSTRSANVQRLNAFLQQRVPLLPTSGVTLLPEKI
ncbi:LysR substrate-binding domain-containing protein [Pantoea sp. A4]|uniref:LysR substrate-binding domain-containing protein n=1 Tax=Pantoea sp. A4 TaxID=1225184 RepID=UPI00035E5471|nr:LysR substrate-binding domain-containing protein [Pantoea sp. A4]